MDAIIFLSQGMFKTDGTSAGTTLVKPFAAGSFMPARTAVSLGNLFVFAAQDEGINQLWITDGTDAGTSLITIFPATANGYAEIGNLTTVGNHVMFNYTDGSNPGYPPCQCE